MATEMPQELKERLPHEPKLWIRNFLRHPEDPTRPYDFWDATGKPSGQFLHYLVDDDGPIEPDNWGDINILLFARGCLKTFTCTAIASWAVDCYPTIEGAATAPRDDQRYEVVERFKQKVEQAGLDSNRSKDKLSYQQFEHEIKDEHGNLHTSYSELKSRSAWGEGDALRGIHGHFGVIDEAQDVDEGTFSTFAMEAIDREVPSVDYFPSIFVIGTPKLANTFYHKLWQMAETRSWDEDEGEWIKETDGDEFLPEPLKERRNEIEERIEHLEETDGDPDEIATLQEEADSIEGFTVKGWHIDQHNSPLHDDTRIAFKKETYSKKKFENEVKANFYSPENDLLTNDDVWRAFDEAMGFQASRKQQDSTVALGVDWGGGSGEGAASTVVVIGEATDDTIETRHIDIFDSSMSFREEVEEIDHLMNTFNVDVAVVDEGYGDAERQELQDEYGHKDLYGAYFGNVKSKEDIKWNRFEDEKKFFTCNKPYMVRRFAEEFKNGYVVIPEGDLSFATQRDKGSRIIDQLTAPYTDRTETDGGKKKLKVISDRNDDIFDAFLYMWMAAKKVHSGPDLAVIGGNMRQGYE